MKQKNISSDLVTKGYLDIIIDEAKRDIDEKAREYRDEILTRLDGAMGELESRRENDVIGTYQRIMRLEHRQVA